MEFVLVSPVFECVYSLVLVAFERTGGAGETDASDVARSILNMEDNS